MNERSARRIQDGINYVETRLYDLTRTLPAPGTIPEWPTEDFENTSGEVMPPCGVGAVLSSKPYGTFARTFQTTKPDGTAYSRYLVNENNFIGPYGDIGQGRLTGTVFVLWDGDTEPQAGELWVPKAGSWGLEQGSGPWGVRITGVYSTADKIATGIIETGGDALIRFRLSEPLYTCDIAEAVLLNLNQSSSGNLCDCPVTPGSAIVVQDTIGAVNACLLAIASEDGRYYVPANATGFARLISGGGSSSSSSSSSSTATYEVISFGEISCDSSSSDASASDSSACLDVSRSVLANVPYAPEDEVPEYYLGLKSGCIKWYKTTEC